jgi:glycosyltransferase involved in cell wall biosynthesis
MTAPRKLNVLLFWFDDDWGRFGRAYQRVAEQLAQMPEVNHVACMFPPVSARELGLNGALRVRTVTEHLSLITETDYSWFRLDQPPFRLRVSINRYHRARALRAHLRQLGFRAENTVLWLFPPHPYLERLIAVVPHRLVICHVIDDFTKIDPGHWLHSMAKDQYPRLGQLADMIFTSSEPNREQFSTVSKSCRFFWPAVDKRFIGRAQSLPHRLTGEAPRLGYVGWILDRTDLDLMAHVARQRPQWHLIVVGPQYPADILDRSGLLSLPNVEYRGPIPQDDVPAFLDSLDVCLMPHRDNSYSRSTGPLKLYQYLACGKPVVSTAVAGLERVRHLIRVAAGPDDFIGQIETALLTDSTEDSAKRIEDARLNTWDVRVREMLDTVLAQLDR